MVAAWYNYGFLRNARGDAEFYFNTALRADKIRSAISHAEATEMSGARPRAVSLPPPKLSGSAS